MAKGKISFRLLSCVVLTAVIIVNAGVALRAEALTERLQTHVTYLASEKLEGRRSGTEGANLAAKYIAHEFRKLGLKAPYPENRIKGFNSSETPFLQGFPYVAGISLGKKNTLSFGSGKLESAIVEKDWLPLGPSSNGSFQGNAVFVGYGITASEFDYDDYAKIDPKGKFAIAYAGFPDNTKAGNKLQRYSETRYKAIAARDKGALGLIIIVKEEDFRQDRLGHITNDYEPTDSGLPVVAISRQTASRLIGLTDSSALSDPQSIPQAGLDNLNIKLSVDIKRNIVPTYNVLAIIEGNDPRLKNEAIVLGAHYDHLGFGGDSSRVADTRAIHFGADDNASGTAGLIELARHFSTEGNKPARTLVFIAFSGEEEGALGSKFYVQNPVIPIGDTIAMINMDMIGRLSEDKLTVIGVGTASEWKELISKYNTPKIVNADTATGVGAEAFKLNLTEDGFGGSDHSSFYGKKVPVLFFFTGSHEDYHKPTDTVEKINFTGQSKVVNYISSVVNDIDRNPKRPTYVVAQASSAPGGRADFRVYIGTIPAYSDAKDGLLLEGVRDGSPAAAAGLKAGDKITRLGARSIETIYDYTYSLGELKPNQEIEVEITRDGKKLTLKLTPAEKK